MAFDAFWTVRGVVYVFFFFFFFFSVFWTVRGVVCGCLMFVGRSRDFPVVFWGQESSWIASCDRFFLSTIPPNTSNSG